MEQRTYRGEIEVDGLADALMTRFNHGDLMAQKVRGQEGHLMVQIATRQWGWGAARSALSVGMAPVEGGVRVTVGEQRWLDAAASLAITGLGALVRPLSILGRIDDIARDVGKLTLPVSVREVHIFADDDDTVVQHGTAAAKHYALSGRRVYLRRPRNSCNDWKA